MRLCSFRSRIIKIEKQRSIDKIKHHQMALNTQAIQVVLLMINSIEPSNPPPLIPLKPVETNEDPDYFQLELSTKMLEEITIQDTLGEEQMQDETTEFREKDGPPKRKLSEVHEKSCSIKRIFFHLDKLNKPPKKKLHV